MPYHGYFYYEYLYEEEEHQLYKNVIVLLRITKLYAYKNALSSLLLKKQIT